MVVQNISSSCTDTSVQAFRLSCEVLTISLFAFWFCSNASLGKGFSLLKAAVPGNGGLTKECLTTSANEPLESDESSLYGLVATFVFSRDRLCRVTV